MRYSLIGRLFPAANFYDSDDEEDLQPPLLPPPPRTKGVPQRPRTEPENAEDFFDDDREDGMSEHGEEEDDGEDIERREACEDFNAEVHTVNLISNTCLTWVFRSGLCLLLQVSALII